MTVLTLAYNYIFNVGIMTKFKNHDEYNITRNSREYFLYR